MIGCNCQVCLSNDPRDNRTRPSIVIRYNNRVVLIDTTPDFRFQALREGIDRLDAVFFTHAHADHILGLDDVRVFNFRQKGPIPIYANKQTLGAIQHTFKYIFDGTRYHGALPQLTPHIIKGPIDLFGCRFHPIPVMHGNLEILGFSFGKTAYLTDVSKIPLASKKKLRNLDLLTLDALRHKEHPTHSSVEQALALVKELGPCRAYFTHIAHDLPHAETNNSLPKNVSLAHDGLSIEIT